MEAFNNSCKTRLLCISKLGADRNWEGLYFVTSCLSWALSALEPAWWPLWHCDVLNKGGQAEPGESSFLEAIRQESWQACPAGCCWRCTLPSQSSNNLLCSQNVSHTYAKRKFCQKHSLNIYLTYFFSIDCYTWAHFHGFLNLAAEKSETPVSLVTWGSRVTLDKLAWAVSGLKPSKLPVFLPCQGWQGRQLGTLALVTGMWRVLLSRWEFTGGLWGKAGGRQGRIHIMHQTLTSFAVCVIVTNQGMSGVQPQRTGPMAAAWTLILYWLLDLGLQYLFY